MITDIDSFVQEVVDKYGVYENKTHIKFIIEYLEKFIDTKRLNDVFWAIALYYYDKKSPPIVGNIDMAIREALKDNRINDPYIKTGKYTYNYNVIEAISHSQREETAKLFTDLKKGLHKKIDSDKNLLKQITGEDHE